MIQRSILLILALVVVGFLELSVFSSLPDPLSLIPLTFVFGVLLYHFLRPNIGCAWLVFGGLLLDLMGLPGSPHALAYTLAGLVGLFLSRKVFQSRSLYAMMGLGASMWMLSSLTEEVWMAVRQATVGRPLPVSFYSELFWLRLLVFSVSLLLMFTLIRRSSALLKRRFLLRT